MTSTPQPLALNTQELGNLVRYWVHYDDAAAALNKQIQNIRKLRTSYEAQILQRLAASKQEAAIIQIGDGRVTVGDEKQTQPLSFKTLETFLHEYHLEKKKPMDETAEILKFIRAHRETNVTKCLKRQSNK